MKTKRNKYLLGQGIANELFRLARIPRYIRKQFGDQSQLFTTTTRTSARSRKGNNVKFHRLDMERLPRYIQREQIGAIKHSLLHHMATKLSAIAPARHNSFMPTDRNRIIDIFALYGYQIVFRAELRYGDKLQMMFIKRNRAFLVTDDWDKTSSFVLDFAILHENNFQTRYSSYIHWREYLRMPHTRYNSEELYANINSVILHCDGLWNEIEGMPGTKNDVIVKQEQKKLHERDWQENIVDILTTYRAENWKEEANAQYSHVYNPFSVYESFQQHMPFGKLRRFYQLYSLYLTGSATHRLIVPAQKEPQSMVCLSGMQKMIMYDNVFINTLQEFFQ